jgi:hypothetical protein
LKLRTTGEGPVKEALVKFAGTEVFTFKIVPAGDFTVTAGDTGFAERVGGCVDVVGTGVFVTMGLSGSIHPAITITRIRKPIRKIPEYFIVYSHCLNIKKLMMRIKR